VEKQININFNLNFKCEEITAGEFIKKYDYKIINDYSYINKDLLKHLSITSLFSIGMLSNCEDDYDKLRCIKNTDNKILVFKNKDFKEIVTIKGL